MRRVPPRFVQAYFRSPFRRGSTRIERPRGGQTNQRSGGGTVFRSAIEFSEATARKEAGG